MRWEGWESKDLGKLSTGIIEAGIYMGRYWKKEMVQGDLRAKYQSENIDNANPFHVKGVSIVTET